MTPERIKADMEHVRRTSERHAWEQRETLYNADVRAALTGILVSGLLRDADDVVRKAFAVADAAAKERVRRQQG